MSNWCYRLSRLAARPAASALTRLRVWRSPGTIEPEGAAIVVSNHISHFDPVFLSFVFSRPVDWMTSAEFYDNPAASAWLRAVDTFPVDRSRPDRRALRVALERLRRGRLVGIFPEGGIRAGASSILGGTAPKSGTTALARLSGAPIIPCLIFGSDRLYALRSWRPGPPRVSIWIAMGTPLRISKGEHEGADELLADTLRRLGRETIGHFHLQPDDLPATPAHRKGRETVPLA